MSLRLALLTLCLFASDWLSLRVAVVFLPRQDEMTYLRPGSLSVFINTEIWFSIPETVPNWEVGGVAVASYSV